MTPVDSSNIYPDEINLLESYGTSLNSITPIPVQSFLVKFAESNFLVHLDSGATVSFIRLQLAISLKIKIRPNGQLALLADEKTRMKSLGEIDILIMTGGKIILRLRALVVKELQVQVYAGTTFHVDNEIVAEMTSGTISLHGGKYTIKQYNYIAPGGPMAYPPPALTMDDLVNIDTDNVAKSSQTSNHPLSEQQNNSSTSQVDSSSITLEDLAAQLNELRNDLKTKLTLSAMQPTMDQTKRMTISVNERKTVLPRDTYEIKLNQISLEEDYVAVIPQFLKSSDPGQAWNPQMCRVKNGHAFYQNNSDQMLTHHKGVHFRTIGAVEITKEDLEKKVIRRTPGPDLSQPGDTLETFSEMKINTKIMTKL